MVHCPRVTAERVGLTEGIVVKVEIEYQREEEYCHQQVNFSQA
jgi:hypothetical protein